MMNRKSQCDGGIEDSRAVEVKLEIVTAGNSAHLQRVSSVSHHHHHSSYDATHVIDEIDRNDGS
jgi:hypothetical protein